MLSCRCHGLHRSHWIYRSHWLHRGHWLHWRNWCACSSRMCCHAASSVQIFSCLAISTLSISIKDPKARCVNAGFTGATGGTGFTGATGFTGGTGTTGATGQFCWRRRAQTKELKSEYHCAKHMALMNLDAPLQVSLETQVSRETQASLDSLETPVPQEPQVWQTQRPLHCTCQVVPSQQSLALFECRIVLLKAER